MRTGIYLHRLGAVLDPKKKASPARIPTSIEHRDSFKKLSLFRDSTNNKIGGDHIPHVAFIVCRFILPHTKSQRETQIFVDQRVSRVDLSCR